MASVIKSLPGEMQSLLEVKSSHDISCGAVGSEVNEMEMDVCLRFGDFVGVGCVGCV